MCVCVCVCVYWGFRSNFLKISFVYFITLICLLFLSLPVVLSVADTVLVVVLKQTLTLCIDTSLVLLRSQVTLRVTSQ